MRPAGARTLSVGDGVTGQQLQQFLGGQAPPPRSYPGPQHAGPAGVQNMAPPNGMPAAAPQQPQPPMPPFKEREMAPQSALESMLATTQFGDVVVFKITDYHEAVQAENMSRLLCVFAHVLRSATRPAREGQEAAIFIEARSTAGEQGQELVRRIMWACNGLRIYGRLLRMQALPADYSEPVAAFLDAAREERVGRAVDAAFVLGCKPPPSERHFISKVLDIARLPTEWPEGYGMEGLKAQLKPFCSGGGEPTLSNPSPGLVRARMPTLAAAVNAVIGLQTVRFENGKVASGPGPPGLAIWFAPDAPPVDGIIPPPPDAREPEDLNNQLRNLVGGQQVAGPAPQQQPGACPGLAPQLAGLTPEQIAALDLRIDPTDGHPYALQDFQAYYGVDEGRRRYEQAVPQPPPAGRGAAPALAPAQIPAVAPAAPSCVSAPPAPPVQIPASLAPPPVSPPLGPPPQCPLPAAVPQRDLPSAPLGPTLQPIQMMQATAAAAAGSAGLNLAGAPPPLAGQASSAQAQMQQIMQLQLQINALRIQQGLPPLPVPPLAGPAPPASTQPGRIPVVQLAAGPPAHSLPPAYRTVAVGTAPPSPQMATTAPVAASLDAYLAPVGNYPGIRAMEAVGSVSRLMVKDCVDRHGDAIVRQLHLIAVLQGLKLGVLEGFGHRVCAVIPCSSDDAGGEERQAAQDGSAQGSEEDNTVEAGPPAAD
eukprot:TRINITY_DN10717_c0_g1_i2.p1 TRINITY_DN10717_c0_g1~~TRINITY_DN10717_c0_g1_i2.p1  ORF type:complete len:707 (+),score=188.19 TRINITY_DN10717_c0_g1_i2:215-2335(+)